MKNNEELRFQSECYLWMHEEYPYLRGLFFSMANESRSRKEAGIRKALGLVVRKGVFDFHVDIPTKKNSGLKIDFKSSKGSYSKEQKQMLELYEALGFRCEKIKPPLANFKRLISEHVGQADEAAVLMLKEIYNRQFPIK